MLPSLRLRNRPRPGKQEIGMKFLNVLNETVVMPLLVAMLILWGVFWLVT